MNIRFTRRAKADLEGIFGYLNNKSPRGARHALAAIHASIKVIEDHPLASLATDRTGLRVIFVVRYRYKVFYRVRANEIEIVRIRHAARRPWP